MKRIITILLFMLLVPGLCFGALSAWNGKTLDKSSGNINAINGKTVGHAAGNINKINGISIILNTNNDNSLWSSADGAGDVAPINSSYGGFSQLTLASSYSITRYAVQITGYTSTVTATVQLYTDNAGDVGSPIAGTSSAVSITGNGTFVFPLVTVKTGITGIIWVGITVPSSTFDVTGGAKSGSRGKYYSSTASNYVNIPNYALQMVVYGCLEPY